MFWFEKEKKRKKKKKNGRKTFFSPGVTLWTICNYSQDFLRSSYDDSYGKGALTKQGNLKITPHLINNAPHSKRGL